MLTEDEARNLYGDLKRTWREFLRLASESANGTDAQSYVTQAIPSLQKSEKLREAFHGHFKKPIDDDDVYWGGHETTLKP